MGQEDKYLKERLLKVLRNEKPYELHCHLMGMGSSTFWVENIIKDDNILPPNSFFKKNDQCSSFYPLIWDKDKQNFFNIEYTEKIIDKIRSYSIDEVKSNEDSDIADDQQLSGDHSTIDANISDDSRMTVEDYEDDESIERDDEDDERINKLVNDLIVVIESDIRTYNLSFKEDFSFDVIHDLDSISKALGNTKYNMKEQRDFLETDVLGKLGLSRRKNNTDDKIFKYWIIFNARKQCLEVVYGITNELLCECIGVKEPKSSDEEVAYALISNAFSMSSIDGLDATHFDMINYRGCFTPEFYPRRFILKDTIYRQRLDVLAYLLCFVLDRYNSCIPKVEYVEFSVGINDLSSKWIFKILCSASSIGEKDCMWNERKFRWMANYKKNSVRYKFLAGISREKTDIVKNNLNLLVESPQIAIRKFLYEMEIEETKMFGFYKKRLESLKKSFNLDNNKDECHNEFYEWIVGFDLFGDELGYPYIPFVIKDFIRFSEEAKKHNPRFGFRIHCGENVPMLSPNLPSFRMFVAHMYITYRGIKFLKEKNFNLRIGHGIAFCAIFDGEPDDNRKSSLLFNEMKTNLESLFRNIPFEINLTSNFYLLHNHGLKIDSDQDEEHALSVLLSKNIPVIISTDDDGIWPLDQCECVNPIHFSLPHEFCRAISSDLIKKEEDLKKIIEHSHNYSFIVTDVKKRKGRVSENLDKGFNSKRIKSSESSESNKGKSKKTELSPSTDSVFKKRMVTSKDLSKSESDILNHIIRNFGNPLALYFNFAHTLSFSVKFEDNSDVKYIFCSEQTTPMFDKEPRRLKELEHILSSINFDTTQKITIYSFCNSLSEPCINSIKDVFKKDRLKERVIVKISSTLNRHINYNKEEAAYLKINNDRDKFSSKPMFYAICDHSPCVSTMLNFLFKSYLSDKTGRMELLSIDNVKDCSQFIIPYLPKFIVKTAKEKEVFSFPETIKDRYEIENDLVRATISVPEEKYSQIYKELSQLTTYDEFEIDNYVLLDSNESVEMKKHIKLHDIREWIKEFNSQYLVPTGFVISGDKFYIENPIIEPLQFIDNKDTSNYIYCTKVSIDKGHHSRFKKWIDFLWPSYSKLHKSQVRTFIDVSRKCIELYLGDIQSLIVFLIIGANRFLWSKDDAEVFCEVLKDIDEDTKNSFTSHLKNIKNIKVKNLYVFSLNNPDYYKLGNHWQRRVLEEECPWLYSE